MDILIAILIDLSCTYIVAVILPSNKFHQTRIYSLSNSNSFLKTPPYVFDKLPDAKRDPLKANTAPIYI